MARRCRAQRPLDDFSFAGLRARRGAAMPRGELQLLFAAAVGVLLAAQQLIAVLLHQAQGFLNFA
jgi:hypothetical protein